MGRALAIEPAETGDVAVFAGSVAVVRLIIAVAHAVSAGRGGALRERVSSAAWSPRSGHTALCGCCAPGRSRARP